jgi:hypothetical protein
MRKLELKVKDGAQLAGEAGAVFLREMLFKTSLYKWAVCPQRQTGE